VLTNNGAALGGGTNHFYTISTNTPGAAIGLYADLRAALASSPVGLDNLRIVPEPAAWTLALVGLVGLRRRR
jgi:hypothetical protein